MTTYSIMRKMDPQNTMKFIFCWPSIAGYVFILVLMFLEVFCTLLEEKAKNQPYTCPAAIMPQS